MTDQDDTAAVESAIALLATAQQAATAYGRPDLAARLGDKASSLGNPAFHVLVVGEFKQGKSSLLNALVARPVCPVDDDIATAVPTVLRWADELTADVLFRPEESTGDERPPPVRQSIPVEDIPLYAVERVSDGRPVHSVEIGVPSRLLRSGLVMVDTPGVGGLGSTHGAVTAAAIPMAEAVIFVTDAGQEFTAPELEFMEATRKLCPNIVCLMTKTDFYPAWRRIRDLNAGHLQRLGIPAPIIATSATLHATAVSSGDGALLAESGYPELISFLRKDILGSATALSITAAASDLHDVLDQLTDHFTAQLAVLEDPESAQAKIRDLERAQARAEELKSRAARWQTTLSDGLQDLNTDVEHDLRDRFRRINQDSDEALEDVDPAQIWDEFEPWLYHRASVEVVKNYEFLQERSRRLAQTVAEHFESDFGELRVDLDVIDPTSSLAQVQSRATLDVTKVGAGQLAMMGMRGGMGGMMMFGLLSSIVGVALGPIGIGLGAVMGRKQVRDERAKALTQRRTQAKAAQRKYMDEATFRTSKDARDALRMIHRQIRDYFTSRAEEQATSIQEMLTAVQSAARLDQEERVRQLADVKAELGRLEAVRQRVHALAPDRSGLAPAGSGP